MKRLNSPYATEAVPADNAMLKKKIWG